MSAGRPLTDLLEAWCCATLKLPGPESSVSTQSDSREGLSRASWGSGIDSISLDGRLSGGTSVAGLLAVREPEERMSGCELVISTR